MGKEVVTQESLLDPSPRPTLGPCQGMWGMGYRVGHWFPRVASLCPHSCIHALNLFIQSKALAVLPDSGDLIVTTLDPATPSQNL